MAGNARKCVRERLESVRTRYGRAGEAPCHSGGARHAIELGRWSQTVCVPS